jgi:hydroxymethylpyrimidine/phosphomethylpyrimidine kinase
MATSLELLNQSLLNVDQQIATLTATINPDYNLDGQGEALSSHLAMLMEKREKLVAAIIQAEGPVEVHVQGYAG